MNSRLDLITGVGGFLGGHLARRLGRDGRRLRAIVRQGTAWQKLPSEISEVEWGDLNDPACVDRAVSGVDTIFHVAARLAGGSKQQFHTDNVVATERLLESALKAGVRRFVHVSSAGIFGTGGGDLVTAETPLDPRIELRGFYAWSKAQADRRVRDFGSRHSIEVVVVRPGILYGPGLAPFFARFSLPIPRSGGRRIIVGSRDVLIPLTYVENACDAIALAAERGAPGQSYNVIDGDVSQGEYLDALEAAGKHQNSPVFLAARWMVPAALACEIVGKLIRRTLPLSRYKLSRATESLRYDTSLARRELGWSPTVGLAEGLRRTLATPDSERAATSDHWTPGAHGGAVVATKPVDPAGLTNQRAAS